MRLRLLATSAIAALVALFLLKGAGTVWPALFDPAPLARASAAIRLAASLLLLLFFHTLRTSLEEAGRRALAAAAAIAVAGSGIGVLVDLRSLLVSVDLASVTREALAAGSLGEASSVAALAWFFLLWRRSRRGARGTGLAIAGASLLGLLALAVFVLRACGLSLEWLAWWSYAPALALSAVAAFGVAALARFFLLLALDPRPLAG